MFRVMLPPSETKRPGGDGPALDLASLALPVLAEPRDQTIGALIALSADEDHAARVLKLSARQRGDIAANARLRESATMPAMDRYTGVLFDALDAASLTPASREWMARHVLIHSAPLGPVRAGDLIPTYRLAAGTSLPGLSPLRRVWADAVSRALAAERPDFVLDMRSEAYVALGPAPAEVSTAYVRVVTPGENGAVRALNHFNKHAKGAFVRALALSQPDVRSAHDLQSWADAHGWELRAGAPGELDLVVS